MWWTSEKAPTPYPYWWQKRLEKARFKWPRKVEDEVITLTGQQLNWLLDGYDVMRLTPHERLHFSSVL